MKEKKYIKTLSEFEEIYFPRSYKKKKEKERTPEELGVSWAKDTIKILKKRTKIFA